MKSLADPDEGNLLCLIIAPALWLALLPYLVVLCFFPGDGCERT